MNDKKSIEFKEKPLSVNSFYWQVQKVGYVVMALILLLAFFGMTGSGIFGKKTTSDDNQIITVEFDPFIRVHADTNIKLKINLTKIPVKSRLFRIWIEQQNLDKNLIKQISPKPYLEQATADKVIYYFAVDEKAELLNINFWIEPEESGFALNRVGILNGPMLTYKQLVFP